MVNLLSIRQIIYYVSVIYAAFIAFVVYLNLKFFHPEATLWSSVGIAFAEATPLQIALLIWIKYAWRYLWKHIPRLNDLLFPDIGGDWKMKIEWQGFSGANGTVQASAKIRQDFVEISMDVDAPASDSLTLSVQSKKDPGTRKMTLYYVYLVTPKAINGNTAQPYYGSATLLYSSAKGGQLSGNYWTSAHTRGHILLSR
jgi:hypothetical protein